MILTIGYTDDNKVINIDINEPLCKEAIEIFKTYGIIKRGYVYLERHNLYMDQDQNRIVKINDSLCENLQKVQNQKDQNKKKTIRPSFIKATTELTCTVTGLKIAPGEDCIKTEEGHVYSRPGIVILFSGKQKKIKSPYAGASDLIRPYLKK